MHGSRLEEDLGRAGPDHNDAIHGLFEGADIGPQLLG